MPNLTPCVGRLTDLSWSPDGRTLVASSTDGFCSVITFNDRELGEVLSEPEVDEAANRPGEDSPKKFLEYSVPTYCSNLLFTTEPMEVQKQDTPEPREKPEVSEPKSTTPKIKSYMKFKTPSEKSPKKQATGNNQQKTPVKLDVLMETAMQSWSDNSQSDIIKPAADRPTEVIEIDDSEDMKLVYEDTECSIVLPTEEKSPESKEVMPAKEVKPLPAPAQPARQAPRRVSFVTLSSPKNKNKKC